MLQIVLQRNSKRITFSMNRIRCNSIIELQDNCSNSNQVLRIKCGRSTINRRATIISSSTCKRIERKQYLGITYQVIQTIQARQRHKDLRVPLQARLRNSINHRYNHSTIMPYFLQLFNNNNQMGVHERVLQCALRM